MKNPLHFATFLISPCPCERLPHMGWESLVYGPMFYPTAIQEWGGMCYNNQDSSAWTS